VAAKISTFLAFVIRVRAREKIAENTTIIPSWRLFERIKYRAMTEEIGRMDEITVANVPRTSSKVFSS